MMWWPHEGWGSGWMVVMMLVWVVLLGFGIWAVVALYPGPVPASGRAPHGDA